MGALLTLPLCAEPALQWQRAEDLPDPAGRKGMFGGVSEGHLILAGGSNFPVPQREGGTKRFHRDLFVCPLPWSAGASWRVLGDALPVGQGEGASVTTAHGIWCVGGQAERGALAEVGLLRWDRTAGRVVRQAMPDLPSPAALAVAVEFEGWIYVAGGVGDGGALRKFWRLDAARAVASAGTTAWETLPEWPGPARFGAALAPVVTAAGPRLWLGGGIAGAARSQADYLRDAMLFDPRAGRWVKAAMLPRGAVLGAAIATEPSRVLLLGGSDGHDFEQMRVLGERYRLPAEILAYDGRADRWSRAGDMPLGVVGATVVKVDDGWVVAAGEPSPGLRTPRVYGLRLGRP